jgi:hypothetical protein
MAAVSLALAMFALSSAGQSEVYGVYRIPEGRHFAVSLRTRQITGQEHHGAFTIKQLEALLKDAFGEPFSTWSDKASCASSVTKMDLYSFSRACVIGMFLSAATTMCAKPVRRPTRRLFTSTRRAAYSGHHTSKKVAACGASPFGTVRRNAKTARWSADQGCSLTVRSPRRLRLGNSQSSGRFPAHFEPSGDSISGRLRNLKRHRPSCLLLDYRRPCSKQSARGYVTEP